MELLPWYNESLIRFLNSYINDSMDVFEYGGGNSTIYYSTKVKSVSTIETRKHWLHFILKNLTKNNVELKLCHTLNSFANEIENFTIKAFDIIVIDSRDREKCLLKSINFLKLNGIMILDNSERENLKHVKRQILDMGFCENIFTGSRLDGSFSVSSIFSKNGIF